MHIADAPEQITRLNSVSCLRQLIPLQDLEDDVFSVPKCENNTIVIRNLLSMYRSQIYKT